AVRLALYTSIPFLCTGKTRHTPAALASYDLERTPRRAELLFCLIILLTLHLSELISHGHKQFNRSVTNRLTRQRELHLVPVCVIHLTPNDQLKRHHFGKLESSFVIHRDLIAFSR